MTDNTTEQSGESGPILREALTGKGVRSASSGISRVAGRSSQETLLRNPLMTLDEVGYYFARERGNLLAFLPAAGPVALRRCVYFSKADSGLFGGCFDPAPGRKPPPVRR